MQTDLFDMGKQVRNISYEKTKNNPNIDIQLNKVNEVLKDHPEGVTDIEISVITGISRSSVNARRNELKNVDVVGIAVYTDENGDSRLNSLWGLIKDKFVLG